MKEIHYSGQMSINHSVSSHTIADCLQYKCVSVEYVTPPPWSHDGGVLSSATAQRGESLPHEA